MGSPKWVAKMFALLLLVTLVECRGQTPEERDYQFVATRSALTNRGQVSDQVVFPGSTAQQHHRQAASLIYVNPQPSTSSRSQPLVADSANQSNKWTKQGSSFVAPLNQRAQATNAHRRPNSMGSTPSSIDKSERQQVAEWPFFKSIQSIRAGSSNAQLNQRPSTSMAMFTSPPDLMRTSNTPQSTSTATTSITSTTSTTTEVPSTTRASEGTTTSSPTSSTHTQAPGSTMSATKTSTTTVSSRAEPEVSDEAEDSEENQEASTSTTSTSTSITSSSTTTTSAPQSVTLARDQLEQAVPTFSSDLHKDIQMALNRLYEMGATRMALGGEQDKAKDKANVVRLNGGGLRQDSSERNSSRSSSLALNVLLKNFGSLNLSSLDQILLRSNLNNRNHSLPATAQDQRLEINGSHKYQLLAGQHADNDSINASTNSIPWDGAAAECKIEYTMKHVNISLVNNDQSDYTCDYIIDRKVNLGANETSVTAGGAKRVCKLHLRSKFFANESQTDDLEDPCSSSSYLSIGKWRFCYQPSASGLDRLFNFPLDKELFDIRLVHMRNRKRDGEPGVSNEARSNEDAIHLEIKPIVDGDCEQQQASAQAARELPVAGERVPVQDGTAKRKLVLKEIEAEERTRASKLPTSQTFELDKPAAASGRKADWHSLPLCGEVSANAASSVHVSTIGQLTSQNYPSNYTTNLRCRHQIKRVSQAYCQLLLHFRDFDLVNTNRIYAPSRSADGQLTEYCLEDYLQIGETRYCNRYAMVGHKMYLNYSAPEPSASADSGAVDETITLVFNSDSRHTGRGFLIKYQQLLCSQDGTGRAPARAPSAKTESDGHLSVMQGTHSPGGAKLHTLAPPLEQPDFGLALRTSSKPQELGKRNPDTLAERKQVKSANGDHDDHDDHDVHDDDTLVAPRISAQQRAAHKRRAQSAPAAHLQAASGARAASASHAHETSNSLNGLQAEQTASTASISKRNSDRAHDVQCNQVNSDMSFLISSYNYPNSYLNDLHCLYYVRRNSSRVCYLELTFVKFDLESDLDCRYDFLEINNVRLCGSLRDLGEHKTTRIYLFEGAVKMIKFRSDSRNTRDGFLIRVDQLECAPDGSILRASRQPAGHQAGPMSSRASSHEQAPSAWDRTQSGGKMFEYDSSLLGANGRQAAAAAAGAADFPAGRWAAEASLRARSLAVGSTRQRQSFLSSSETALPATSSAAGGCDDLLYGNELTIKSPNWPESYTNDESISACKYTIVRNQQRNKASKMPCQLELRFVHLRLSFADCLDIDGMETLCGFNTRNLVKYYPFGEHQTHLTITFTTNAAKFARKFRLLDPAAGSSGAQNHSDLLPSSRAPHRFMIIARQLDCIDDFLAPQVELEPLGLLSQRADSSSVSAAAPTGAARASAANATNLLYAEPKLDDEPARVARPRPQPRYANRTQPLNAASNSSVRQLDPAPARGQASSELSRLHSNSSARAAPARDGVLMYSFAGSVSSSAQDGRSEQRSSTTVELREIHISDDFFELDSRKLSRLSSVFYDPNMFVIYKLRKSRPQVCKLRLMFYRFELEPAWLGPSGPMCKRDFLDIDNSDRLCGSLDARANESSRDYDWPAHQEDFQISFVSDSSVQRAGFHIFGQQLADARNCPAAQATAKPTQTPYWQSGKESAQAEEPVGRLQAGSVERDSPASGVPRGGTHEAEQQQKTASKHLAANCSLIVEDLNFELASPNWPRPYDALGQCHYLLRRAPSLAESICSVTLRVNSLILDLNQTSPRRKLDESEGGLCDESHDLSQTDYLELDGHVRLCGLLARPRTFTFDFVDAHKSAGPAPPARQFIIAKFVSNGARGFGFHIEGQQNKCPTDDQQQQQQQQQQQPLVKFDDSKPSSGAFESAPVKQAPEAAPAPSKRPLAAAGASEFEPDSEQSGDKQAGQPEPARGCNRLLIGHTNLLESENFPNLYPNNQNCLYAVRRMNQSVCAIDLILNYFDLEDADQASGLCQNDYLELDYSRFCGSYPAGHRLRFNFYDSELDKLVRFKSDASKARNGFSLTLEQVSECGQPASSGGSGAPPVGLDAGSAPHSTPAGQRELINYAPDSEASSQLAPELDASANNKTHAQEARPSAGYVGLSRAASSTLCQFVYHSERQLLVSPGYDAHRPHYDDQLDCQYKIVAASYDVCALRLTIIELELEHSAGCLKDYLLIDNRRYCGKLANLTGASPADEFQLAPSARRKSPAAPTPRPLVIELEFSAQLPREIDLLFHTDSHVNAGRGFKLLSEQLPCGPQSEAHTDQEFRTQTGAQQLDAESVARARQVRRMRFGQLHYPKNYVSSAAAAAASSQPGLKKHSATSNGAAQGRGQAASNEPAKMTRASRSGHEPEAAPPVPDEGLDLKLSKEIVVTRAQQQPSRSNQMHSSV